MRKIVKTIAAGLAVLMLVGSVSLPAFASEPSKAMNRRQAADELLARATRDMSQMEPVFIDNPQPQVQKQYQQEFVEGMMAYNNGSYATAAQHFNNLDQTLRGLPEWSHLE